MKKLLLTVFSALSLSHTAFGLISANSQYLLNNKAGNVPFQVQLGDLIKNAESLTGPALASGQIVVGNGSGIAAAVTPSGDATLSNAGVFTLANPAIDGLLVKRVARATYDFAVNGGLVSTITLPVTIPAKAIITNVILDILTTCTSGGSATVAVGANSTTDLLGATAVASMTSGLKAGVPVGTAATAVKATAAAPLTVTIGTAALTAGKFTIFAEYNVSQ